MPSIRATWESDSSTPSMPILERYYPLIEKSIASFNKAQDTGSFEPAFNLPPLDDAMRRFLAPASARFVELGQYEQLPLRLLDLRQNPATQNTNTFASTLIAARAVQHIRRTGESLLLFSPSSGNKAIALRDAVERALKAGLVDAAQLRIATLTPRHTLHKMRSGALSENPELRVLNPVFVLDHPVPEQVKQVGLAFKSLYSRNSGRRQPRLWHSLNLANYQFADQARAFFDHEFGSAADVQRKTLHAHAVSSAYGLLGYQAGLNTLKSRGEPVSTPAYLLVQHLATSDMVRHLLTGNFDRQAIPAYHQNERGIWRQFRDPHFPLNAWDPEEVLEPTLYTHHPATAARMSALIRAQGGSGIVVSLLECIERYGQCRTLLDPVGIRLPADPRELREWSLVMGMTGLLNAIDRGLIGDVDGCTLHASGSYANTDYRAIPHAHVIPVTNAGHMLDLLLSDSDAG